MCLFMVVFIPTHGVVVVMHSLDTVVVVVLTLELDALIVIIPLNAVVVSICCIVIIML